MVKKSVSLSLILSLVLLLGSLIGSNSGFVNAQTYDVITITSDGDVEGTSLIERDGNVYTFIGNIMGTINVEKSGITIDGAGFSLSVGSGIDLRENKKSDLSPAYGNVTVKNVRFCGGSGVCASSNGNIFINNTFEGGEIFLRYNENTGVIIKHNVFINCEYALSVDYASGVNVVENDFINSKIGLHLYGRASFDRNYWSDYKTVYPDAKENGNTGIWDTPYNSSTTASDLSFVDYNPLVNPIKTETQNIINLTKSNSELPITHLIAIAAILAVIAVIAVSCRKKISFNKKEVATNTQKLC
ncbi:MAG: hypothetical protein ACFCUE_13080 [Candidatus Bathyarchaeia archaeon]